MQVGWPKRPAKKLETALLGSYLVSSVVRRELDPSGATTNEQLIGLIRCTSDQVFNATIWDVLVDPEYQASFLLHLIISFLYATSCHAGAVDSEYSGPLLKGKGIGRFLVIKTVEALKREQIGNICLFADAEGGASHKCRTTFAVFIYNSCDAPQCDLTYCTALAAVGFYEQLGFKCDPDGVRCDTSYLRNLMM